MNITDRPEARTKIELDMSYKVEEQRESENLGELDTGRKQIISTERKLISHSLSPSSLVSEIKKLRLHRSSKLWMKQEPKEEEEKKESIEDAEPPKRIRSEIHTNRFISSSDGPNTPAQSCFVKVDLRGKKDSIYNSFSLVNNFMNEVEED